MKRNIFIVVFVFLVVGFIYRALFSFLPISGGDYISMTASQLFTWKYFSFYVWSTNIDLGWAIIPLLASAPYTFLIGWIGSLFGNNGVIVERLVWWLPFFIIGFYSSFTLSKKILNNQTFSWIAPLIFLFNTYILLIISGGQVAGIGLAYAFSPVVLLSFIFLLKKPTFECALLTGIVLSIILMFDLRITYITLVGVGLYIFVQFISHLKTFTKDFKNVQTIVRYFIFIVVIPGLVVGLIHAFWLIPMAIVRQNPLQQLGAAYNTTSAVRFFSFGNFENAMGLLHPNWPENIFGKTYFMRPEFLLLPILAFSSLFFINKKKSESGSTKNLAIIYFVLMALVGIFLAKGANNPFGGVYLWMFGHIPGFMMFRDPTKWYLLIAISYSMLISYTVSKIYEWLQEKFV